MCNSAVQCGSKKAQSFGMDESTVEYLAKMTTVISPSFSVARGEENQPYDLVHKFITICI